MLLADVIRAPSSGSFQILGARLLGGPLAGRATLRLSRSDTSLNRGTRCHPSGRLLALEFLRGLLQTFPDLRPATRSLSAQRLARQTLYSAARHLLDGGLNTFFESVRAGGNNEVLSHLTRVLRRLTEASAVNRTLRYSTDYAGVPNYGYLDGDPEFRRRSCGATNDRPRRRCNDGAEEERIDKVLSLPFDGWFYLWP